MVKTLALGVLLGIVATATAWALLGLTALWMAEEDEHAGTRRHP